MPRAPVSALFGLLFGLAFLLPGLALLGWVALTKVDTAKGFDAAMGAMRYVSSDSEENGPAFGNWAINRTLPIGLMGGLLSIVGIAVLASARKAMLPADVSDDGSARIVFEPNPPTAGHRLQGYIELTDDDKDCHVCMLELRCIQVGRGDHSDRHTVHFEQYESDVKSGARGTRIPFSFEVPINAPPSNGTGLLGLSSRHDWSIHLDRSGETFDSSSDFDFEMHAPSAQDIRSNAVKSAETIRAQRLAWNVVGWGLTAYVAIFHAIPFVMNEIAGRR